MLRKERMKMNITEKEGAWCWFADPRAISYKGRTFIGCIDVHGNIKAIMLYEGKKTEVLVRSNFQPDDHDNPTFLVLPDERIMIIYSRHTDEACFYYRISKNKCDITDLGEEKCLKTNHNTTYPSLFIMEEDKDHIYLCYRGVNWHPTCARLTMPDENDDVFFDVKPFQIVHSTVQGSGCRPYAKYVSDGKNKIHMVYSATHPDNVYPVCIYYSCLDISDFSLHDIEGDVLKENVREEPFKVTGYETDSKFVIDPYYSSKRGWVWDVAVGENGVSAAIVNISEDKVTQHYYYTYYNDGAWEKIFIGNAHKFHKSDVEFCYGGGMSLDRDREGVVYVSMPMGTAFEIVKYTIDRKNVSREFVTKYSELNNIRPYKIANGPLVWMNGDYYYWIVNSTYPDGFPTRIVIEGDAGEDRFKDGIKVICKSEDEGVIYSDESVTLKVEGTLVTFCDAVSSNPLSTSDWNKEHNATTDGSTKLVRPYETEFTIVKEEDAFYLLRDGKVDVVVRRK
ncbi:MAG: BNR-4 repeat-containing protein [Clostridia bacterium]